MKVLNVTTFTREAITFNILSQLSHILEKFPKNASTVHETDLLECTMLSFMHRAKTNKKVKMLIEG